MAALQARERDTLFVENGRRTDRRRRSAGWTRWFVLCVIASGCASVPDARDGAVDSDAPRDSASNARDTAPDEPGPDGTVSPDTGADGGASGDASGDGGGPVGPAATWRLLRTPRGFQWAAPSGATTCKIAAVSMVDSAQIRRTDQWPSVVPMRYPTWGAWAAAQDARLRSWGFNAAGMYSYAYAANFPPGGVPLVPTYQASGHATRDDMAYHVKNLNHHYEGMVCAPRYQPPGGGQADAFDPGLASAYMTDVGMTSARTFGGAPASAQVFIVPEEADHLFGIDRRQSHTDLGFIVAARSPAMPTSAGGYRYADATLYAKLALRDFLAARYGCAGSADPSAATFCGASTAARALTALNAAWGTTYTTWNTSDPGGLAGIRSGAYAAYGTGTGLLDENGAHVLSADARAACARTTAVDSWWPAAFPAIGTDLHAYVAFFARTYAQKLAAAWAQPSVAPHAPIFLPLYDGPDYVYAAVAPYVDGFWVNPTVPGGDAAALAELQTIIAAAPGKPLIIADYATANPDSPFAATPCDSSGGRCFTTQAARGAGMVAWWRQALHLQDASGVHVVVGLEHWSLYDMPGEATDFGLVTADRDNPYDGTATIANGERANYGDALAAIRAYLTAGICDP